MPSFHLMGGVAPASQGAPSTAANSNGAPGVASTATAAPAGTAAVDTEELVECSACKIVKPRSEFIKNGRQMKTCSVHRVSKDVNSSWKEMVRHIKTAQVKSSPIHFKGRMSFDQFPPMALVADKGDTKQRSRACKRMLAEMHRLTGYRWCYRNTWRLEDSWVAKCACAQDTNWENANVYKQKEVATLKEEDKTNCGSSLTIRLYFTSRIFEIEVRHDTWHKSTFDPPSAKKGKKGSKPDKIGGDDLDFSDLESDAMAAAASSVPGPSRLGGAGASGAQPVPWMSNSSTYGQGAGSSSQMFGPAAGAAAAVSVKGGKMPAFMGGIPSNANSDSYNHCIHLLQRAGHIMHETRSYMLEGDNFSQFRQFFDGIEAFVQAYEQQTA